MSLSSWQRSLVERQLDEHKHQRYTTDIKLTEGHLLEDFIVCPNVLRPKKVTSLHLARWLYFNNGLYSNKLVYDIGSGSGLQAIVMAKYGAMHVVCTDISLDAVTNTQENIDHFEVRASVLQGDLFASLEFPANLIVFNHPFFPGDPIPEIPVSRAMLDNGRLINRFLEEAKNYIRPEGSIIMPYYELAGHTNHPYLSGQEHGYRVEQKFFMQSISGFHRGEISVYQLSLP